MKTILTRPTKENTVKQPPIIPNNNFIPPANLTAEELLDVINQATFEVPSHIKDVAQIALKTVRLSLNHYVEDTEQGKMSLVFIQPCFLDFGHNLVLFYNVIAPMNIQGYIDGGLMWLLLPIGKRYTINFSVQSKRKNTSFHIGVRYKDYSDEFAIDSTGLGQHLTFNIDTRQSVFYGIDIRNLNRAGKHALITKDWTFFNCTIVQLD